MGVAGGGAKHGGVEHVEAGEVCCLRARGRRRGRRRGLVFERREREECVGVVSDRRENEHSTVGRREREILSVT